MLFINKYYLCITFLCIVDAEISKNLSPKQPLIWESVNNSAFILRLNNGSKNVLIANDSNWFLNMETLNSILEHAQAGNSKDPPPLRKRETVLMNHSKSHQLPNDHNDGYFTLYYNGNASQIDQAHFRTKKQVKEEYYRAISELHNIPTIDQAEVPRSPIAPLLNKTSRAIAVKARNSDITVIPMPILTTNSLPDQKVQATSTEYIFKPDKLIESNIDENSLQFKTKTTAKIDSNQIEISTNKINLNEVEDPNTHELNVEHESKEITTRSAAVELNFATSIDNLKKITTDSIFASKQIDKVSNHEGDIALDILENQENKSMPTESSFDPNLRQVNSDNSSSSSTFKIASSASTPFFKVKSSSTTGKSKIIFKEPNTEISTPKNTNGTKNSSIIQKEDIDKDSDITDYDDYDEAFPENYQYKLNKQNTSISTFKYFTKSSSEVIPVINGDGKSPNAVPSTSTTTTIIPPHQPAISIAEVKIIPIKEREYTILLTGIILCCLGILLIVGGLIIYLYQKKKSSSNDIEMITSMRFDETDVQKNAYRRSAEMPSGYVSTL